jgi:ferredoxin-NADP reductase
MKFRFIRSQPVRADVISFIFEPQQPVSWKAGQYFHYLLPHQHEDDRGHERWFTCSAAPFEGHVMISTRINDEHGSSFKRALRALKPGDDIEADGPEGEFIIEDFERNYVFVAGGIGITPFRSILTQANHDGQQLHVDLLYANRNNEIPFQDELDQYAAANPNLKVEYIVQPNGIDIDMLKQRVGSLDNPVVYVSGPKPMVEAFAAQLREIGLPEQSIKTDDFPGYETF